MYQDVGNSYPRMDERLENFISRCRCCLEDTRGDTYVKITRYIEERFFEFTSSQLIPSEKLSYKICLTCNSLLARYAAIKKNFICNQDKLNELLRRSEPDPIVKIEHFKQEPIEPYPIVECPVDDYEGNIKMEAENSYGEHSYDEDTFNDEPFNSEFIPETVLEVKQTETIVFRETPKRRKPSLPYVKRVNGKHCCDQCDYKISKREELVHHKWKHHNGPGPGRNTKKLDEIILMCHLCPSVFKHKDLLKRHLDKHNNVINFICDHCKFQTHARADMIRHLHTHLRREQRKLYYCEFEGCTASYTHKNSLKDHRKSKHLQETPFQCTMCTKAFSKSIRLTNHVKFVHQKIRPILCDILGCSASFMCNAHLVRHKKNIHKMEIKKD